MSRPKCSLDKETFKAQLVRDKAFLKGLFEGPNPLKNRRLLLGASEPELNTLIELLCYVTNGKLRLTHASFKNIKAKKKFKYLVANFEGPNAVESLLNETFENKVEVLMKLSIVFPDLLSPLFYLPKKVSE